MQMTCFAIKKNAPQLVPARSTRPWMDAFPSRHAYRCLPLAIANCYGWEVLSPTSFTITWNGGPDVKDLQFESHDNFPEMSHFVMSNFSHGIVTFHTGYIFRTEPSWNLLASGPFNEPKDGISPLTGVIETDWLPYPFTMNWQLTRAGCVKFEKGEPFCMVFPVPQHALSEVQPEIVDLESDPKLVAQHQAWREKRDEFMVKFRAGDKATLKQAWQKYYFKGEYVDGQEPETTHVHKLRLAMPIDRRPKAEEKPPVHEPALSEPAALEPELFTSVIVSASGSGLQTPFGENGAAKNAGMGRAASEHAVTSFADARETSTVRPIMPRPNGVVNPSPDVVVKPRADGILTRADFLSREECDELIAAFERCRDRLIPAPGRTDKFFDHRFLWINSLPTSTERRAKRIMQAARFRAIEELARFYGDTQPVYSDSIQLVKWPQGMGMPVHADNCHPDGSAHPTAHRKYASVIYLNDDYVGGELYLPGLGIELKPKKGQLVAFKGDRSHEHGVRVVTRGTRYTMPGWYSNDISHRDPFSLETY